MSEHPHDVEALLRGLNPAAPNPELQERVAADLTLDEAWLPRQVRRAPRWLVATGWAGLGAAAAVVAVSLLSPGPSVRPGMEVAAEGKAVMEGGALPASQGRRAATGVKVWSVERRAWIDPEDGAEITVEIPKEEKVVLPVNYQ
jgi:hypothetical protein